MMPRLRLIENFERVTRRSVFVRENGNFNVAPNIEVPIATRSLEQVLRDNRVEKAPLRQAKRAEQLRKKMEARAALHHQQQRKRDEEAAIIQQRIRDEVAAVKQRACAAMKKNRDLHAKLATHLTREKKVLERKFAAVKELYKKKLNHLKCCLQDAKRPALELQKKWNGVHDSDLEFNGIQKYGV